MILSIFVLEVGFAELVREDVVLAEGEGVGKCIIV